MKFKRALCVLLAAVTVVSNPNASAQPASVATTAADLWSKMAQNDLAALRAILEDSHPGSVDPVNPEFRNWLAKGSVAAEALAARTTNYVGLQYTLLHFADGFNDSHVFVYPTLHSSRARYPGFIAALRAGRFTVVESEVAAVPIGAQIDACDGIPAATLYAQTVLPYRGVDGVAAQDVGFAPYLFADFGNPFVARPSSCIVRIEGTTRKVDLDWQGVDGEQLLHRLELAAYGASGHIGLIEWQPGKFWIGLPSFAFTSDSGALADDNVAAMNRLITEAAQHAEKLRTAKLIVFDVRGNDGGSSVWGDRLLEAIWGKGFTDNLARRLYERVDWRVSDANIAANEGYQAAIIKGAGVQSEQAQFYASLIAAMKQGRAAGATLVASPEAVPDKALAQWPIVKPRIVLLGNGTCVSACNDFSDAVLSIKGAELWGADNNADSVYIENRGETLPSGLFRISLPMKVWRGRSRGNNQVFTATRKFDVPFATDEAARAWVDAQLAKKP